jgi:pilus assembly protein CpaC
MKTTTGRMQWGSWGVCTVLALMFAASLPAFAQSENTIQVSVGESVTLSVTNVAKLAVAEPAVADIVSLSENEVSIIGKRVGATTLTIVRSEGKATQIYRIEVGNDAAASIIRKVVSAPGITVRVVGDTLVLDGRVDDELDLQRAVSVANAYYKDKVVNLIEVQKPRQIKIRIRVAEVTLDAIKNIGIQYFGPNGRVRYGFGRASQSEPDGGSFSGHGFLDPAATASQTISLGNAPVGVEALLQLLQQKNYARLLSEPTLVTYSGKEASFLVGQEVPIVQQLPQSFTVEFKEVGVRMKVKPTADSQNRINTAIHAEVSQVTGVQVLGIPIISSKKADTTLQVNDGQTIVIGGLLDNNISRDAMRKLPWLADIPVLGMLFRSKEFQKAQSEVLFFMTPEVIKDVDTDTATAARTPYLQQWNGSEADKGILRVPKKNDDWGMHNPDGLGLPEIKHSPKPSQPKAEPEMAPAAEAPAAATTEPAKEPATNFSPARPAGE